MANKRLIDANALLEKFQFRLPINDHISESIAECVKMSVRIIKDAPTVDAVEVVRCKDCDFACEGSYGLVCTAWGARTDYDMFCGKGERREGE